MKTCSKCKVAKPLSEYNKEKRSSDGLRYSCKTCDKQRMRAYLESLGETGRRERRERQYRRNRETGRDKIYQAQYREKKVARNLWRHARRRARDKNIPFTLTVADVQSRLDRGACEMTGLPFTTGNGLTHDSPSLDRITPAKGYTPENVRLVLYVMNCARGHWGDETLKQVMTKWLES